MGKEKVLELRMLENLQTIVQFKQPQKYVVVGKMLNWANFLDPYLVF